MSQVSPDGSSISLQARVRGAVTYRFILLSISLYPYYGSRPEGRASISFNFKSQHMFANLISSGHGSASRATDDIFTTVFPARHFTVNWSQISTWASIPALIEHVSFTWI